MTKPEPTHRPRRWSWRRAGASGLFHVAAIVISLAFVLPLVWMVSVSLRKTGLTLPHTIQWLPQEPQWQNYLRLFQILPMGRYFLNSLLITALGVPLSLLFGSWAGFAMSQVGKRARRRLLAFTVILMMVPTTALWLARFVMFARLGQTNSYIPLLAPVLLGASPLLVLLFYWNFRRIPLETFESARLDGATPLLSWWHIALPQARPTLAAAAMLAFIFFWNDFITPLLYLRSQRLYTLSIGLMQLQEMDKTNWPLVLAAAALVTLPPLLIFLAVQRKFLNESWLSGK
ncbi:MAG TPA: carbohydrate ABC transporter permease [Anaerolineales bacterium]|nr:carbohydrate ABC transporter permease [Anaerolineales bacterium]